MNPTTEPNLHLERDATVRRLLDDLAEPFDPKEVKWKPQQVKQNRCLAIAYIDARVIQDRLDDVLGSENWSDEYTAGPWPKSVLCKLTLSLAGRVVSKMDIGGESEQPDEGDRAKAAVSDALKRAAVKWGIGRYLYRLPHQWVDYDPTKKQIAQVPQLPAFAIPAKSRPEVAVKRAASIEGLIRYVCERTKADFGKTFSSTLAEYKVQALADLKTADANQILQRLGARIAALASEPPKPAPQPAAK
jgi:hypothetical protein